MSIKKKKCNIKKVISKKVKGKKVIRGHSIVRQLRHLFSSMQTDLVAFYFFVLFCFVLS